MSNPENIKPSDLGEQLKFDMPEAESPAYEIDVEKIAQSAMKSAIKRHLPNRKPSEAAVDQGYVIEDVNHIFTPEKRAKSILESGRFRNNPAGLQNMYNQLKNSAIPEEKLIADEMFRLSERLRGLVDEDDKHRYRS